MSVPADPRQTHISTRRQLSDVASTTCMPPPAPPRMPPPPTAPIAPPLATASKAVNDDEEEEGEPMRFDSGGLRGPSASVGRKGWRTARLVAERCPDM